MAGFAELTAYVLLLDAVVDAIAKQVDKRVLEFVEDTAVDLDVLALHQEVDLLPLLARQVVNDLGQVTEKVGAREQEHLLGVRKEPVGDGGEGAGVLMGGTSELPK